MSTLADELLQDFEGSGSEAGDSGDQPDGNPSGAGPVTNGLHPNEDTHMRDGDDHSNEDVDEEMEGTNIGGQKLDAADDSDETKAKVEKMQLGGVRDVRSVAGLMKTLAPVLEVSAPARSSPLTPICCREKSIYISCFRSDQP